MYSVLRIESAIWKGWYWSLAHVMGSCFRSAVRLLIGFYNWDELEESWRQRFIQRALQTLSPILFKSFPSTYTIPPFLSNTLAPNKTVTSSHLQHLSPVEASLSWQVMTGKWKKPGGKKSDSFLSGSDRPCFSLIAFTQSNNTRVLVLPMETYIPPVYGSFKLSSDKTQRFGELCLPPC